MDRSQILAKVGRYYTDKVLEHGPSARGVDWNGTESQMLRFAQLAKLFDDPRPGMAQPGPFSVLDYGCGYGAFIELLDAGGWEADFHGFDISEEMVRQARARFGDRPNTRFFTDEAEIEPVDYVVSSGLFNVRQDVDAEAWERYVFDTLVRFARLSRRGFAFNVLTSYSDADRMRDTLYYPNPGVLFDYCKRHFSRHAALLHDYGLYEFTILVRTDDRATGVWSAPRRSGEADRA